MGRRKTHTSPFDRINEDGVLCLILSYLSLKEAVRTCVLSCRWRHIWTQLPDLEFSVENMFHANNFRIMDNKKYAAKLRNKFITSVNSFLHHHQGVGVDKFLLEYSLHKIHSYHLEAWINFAVASKSKLVSFVLGSCSSIDHIIRKKSELCDFPCHLLRSSSVEKLALASCSLKLLPGLGGLSCLKNLELCQVDVTEEDFRGLLSNCHTLEYLRVEGSHLVALSVFQPLSLLTELYVIDCHKLEKIEINAVNMTYLYYWGRPVEFLFGESPKLTKAHIYFESNNLNHAVTILSNNLSHLVDLKFQIKDVSKKFADFASNFNRFIHLRHLVWAVSPSLADRSHICLPVLLNAAPLVEILSLHYKCAYVEETLDGFDIIKRMAPSPHTHLRAVEFEGFYCDEWQVRLLVYILNSATELESMTLRKPGETVSISYQNLFEKNMEHLKLEVPTNVKLVVA